MIMAQRIYMIDDDSDDIHLFSVVLREICPEVEILTAGDGDIALAELFSDVLPLPDYIFLDLNMPRVNGFTCLEEIRKLAKYANVPVLILTTSAIDEDKNKAMQLGASHFLTKPSALEDIRLHMSNLLASRN
jgi:CheY-like chemotaxis protein